MRRLPSVNPLYLAAASGRVLKSPFPEAYYLAGFFDEALKTQDWQYVS